MPKRNPGLELANAFSVKPLDQSFLKLIGHGRATFSAGIYHVMQLRHLANASLIGEPFGDVLDFWSEGGDLLTPHSRLSLHFADRFHSMSAVARPEFREYVVTDTELDITNPGPDTIVRMSARDYFAGRDAALEAVKRHR